MSCIVDTRRTCASTRNLQQAFLPPVLARLSSLEESLKLKLECFGLRRHLDPTACELWILELLYPLPETSCSSSISVLRYTRKCMNFEQNTKKRATHSRTYFMSRIKSAIRFVASRISIRWQRRNLGDEKFSKDAKRQRESWLHFCKRISRVSSRYGKNAEFRYSYRTRKGNHGGF